MGITVFKPSFPPFNCTITSTWSFGVLPFNNWASGDSAPKAFKENPLITVGKMVAGTVVRKNSLRFIK